MCHVARYVVLCTIVYLEYLKQYFEQKVYSYKIKLKRAIFNDLDNIMSWRLGRGYCVPKILVSSIVQETMNEEGKSGENGSHLITTNIF